jgi:RimK family alpha-L-glutamate ligase
LLTLQKLQRAGIPVSKTFLHRPGTDLAIYERELGFPLVLKVIGGSKGKGVVLVDDMERLEDLLGLARAAGTTEELLLQKFVSTSKGRDIRVMLAGGKAVDCAMRQTSKPDGFLANVSAGGTMPNHPLNDDIAEIANAAAAALELFIGGLDLLFTDDGYVVCEANSLPGIIPPRGLPSPWRIDMPKTIMQSIIDAVNK